MSLDDLVQSEADNDIQAIVDFKGEKLIFTTNAVYRMRRLTWWERVWRRIRSCFRES